MGIPDHLKCLLSDLYASQEAMDKTLHGTTDWFKIGILYIVYCHPAYLTYMQSTSCEMPSCVTHKLESSFPGEIPTTSDMQMKPL